MTRTQQEAYEEPLGVEAFDGEVVITGPGRVGVSLTASAAAQTAQRLAAAAEAARTGCSAANQPVAAASQASSSED